MRIKLASPVRLVTRRNRDPSGSLRRQTDPDASHEVLFPSAFTSHAALSGAVRRRLDRREPGQPPDYPTSTFWPVKQLSILNLIVFPQRAARAAALVVLRSCVARTNAARFDAARHGSCMAVFFLPDHVPLSVQRTLRGPTGVVTPRRRPWDFSLRSFAPAFGSADVTVRCCPTCRSHRRRPDRFSSGDWPASNQIDKTHTDLDQLRTMMRGSWDLPPLASRATPPRLRAASRCCPGISLFQVFRTPIGAFVQARPRTNHQPPATASGPTSAHGFYAWIAGKSWLRADRLDNSSSADPSAY